MVVADTKQCPYSGHSKCQTATTESSDISSTGQSWKCPLLLELLLLIYNKYQNQVSHMVSHQQCSRAGIIQRVKCCTDKQGMPIFFLILPLAYKNKNKSLYTSVSSSVMWREGFVVKLFWNFKDIVTF